MATVVDARNFLADTASRDLLADRDRGAGDGDDRAVAELLIDQIEFADVIVINKIDLVTQPERDLLLCSLRKLNPEADILFSEFGRIPLDRLLNTGKFSYDRASQTAGWLKELEGHHHAPETEEYGFRSFVYRARRPFHPDRFHRFITADWPGVIRAKGFFWLASRMEFAGSLSRAGAIVRHEPAGVWWAATDKERWPADPQWRAGVLSNWDERYGDRRQEIVIIGGPAMDQAAMTRALDRVARPLPGLAARSGGVTSLLRELFDAVRRTPEHRAPTAHRLRAVTDAELDSAVAASGLPPCDAADCTCGGEGLIYRRRRDLR